MLQYKSSEKKSRSEGEKRIHQFLVRNFEIFVQFIAAEKYFTSQPERQMFFHHFFSFFLGFRFHEVFLEMARNKREKKEQYRKMSQRL